MRFIGRVVAIAGLCAALVACNRSDDANVVRVALLPVVDTLPYLVAVEEGLFGSHGVEVEAVPVASPVERDQLFQAGEVDGMLNELSTTAVFNADRQRLKSVLTARVPTDQSPVFRILAAPGSGVTGPADLSGIAIGVSMNTIIEYLTDRMLAAEGVAGSVMVSVPVIPERYQLLLAGDIDAATLPDPLAYAAIAAGAIPVIDDSDHRQYSLSVLSFRSNLDDDMIRAVVDGWSEAAILINEDPESYRDLLLESIRMPEPIESTYQLPSFPVRQIPSRDQWDDVVDWLIEKNILDSRPRFEDSVTREYLE